MILEQEPDGFRPLQLIMETEEEAYRVWLNSYTNEVGNEDDERVWAQFPEPLSEKFKARRHNERWEL